MSKIFQKYDDLFPFVAMDPSDTRFEREWLVPGLVMKNKINIFFGAEKAGKSRLLAWMLVKMYGGLPVLGEKPVQSPGKMLYLAGEEVRQEVTGRLIAYQKAAGIPAGSIDWNKKIDFCQASGMRLDKQLQRDWLRERLDQGGYDSLFIDPLRRVHGASESSNDEMAPICNDLRDWTNRYELTLIGVHHTGKLTMDDDETRIATWSRGATDLPAVLDWAVYVKRLATSAQDRVKITRKGRAPMQPDLIVKDLGDSGFRRIVEVD